MTHLGLMDLHCGCELSPKSTAEVFWCTEFYVLDDFKMDLNPGLLWFCFYGFVPPTPVDQSGAMFLG